VTDATKTQMLNELSQHHKHAMHTKTSDDTLGNFTDVKQEMGICTKVTRHNRTRTESMTNKHAGTY